MPCLLLLFLSLKCFLTLVGRFVACCLLVLVVSCICLFFMVIRVLILMLNSLLLLISYLMLLWVIKVLLREVSPGCWLAISTRSPPKSLAWQKGFRLGSGLTWRLPGLWLVVDSQLLLVSVSGVQVVVIVVTLWLVVLWLLLLFFLVGFSQRGGLFLIFSSTSPPMTSFTVSCESVVRQVRGDLCGTGRPVWERFLSHSCVK